MANDRIPMIKLDRSRLLGFDQAPRAGDDDGADPRLARLGAKLGSKFGAKQGLRLTI